MKETSFKFKLIVPTIVVFVLLVVVISVFLSMRLSATGDSLVNEKLLAVTNALNYYIDESKGKSHVAALSMATNPDVVRAVKARDTAGLIDLFSPACDIYRIDYFTITDGKGTVLARTYEPESLGDSILNQQNIRDALEGKVATYFESGTLIMVSIRTGAPVYDADGTLVGAISAGVRFDSESKVEELKRLFESEITIFHGNTRISSTIVRDGLSIVGTTLDPRIADIVLMNKNEYTGDVDVFGEKYKIYCKPLLNAQEDAFAAIFIAIPMANLTAETAKSIRDGILLGLGGLAASILLLYFMISSISQPITLLSSDMRHIADGNLGIDITIRGNDEVGSLGKSLQKVADTLHKLLADINKTIAEHEKGNIEYFLDADAFLGDYRKLADNIIEMAAFGTRDQLTGIPNRRAFDNRLDMEWSRAEREKSPLSILFLDVDKFKNYNDTYGHQQGDVALKSVAHALRQMVKRPPDFSARWGGEEFVALLPSTDAAGAVFVAENVRAEIEKQTIPATEAGAAHVTVSIGVATLVPEREHQKSDIIAAADAALYKAKETGRNRVVLHDVQATGS